MKKSQTKKITKNQSTKNNAKRSNNKKNRQQQQHNDFDDKNDYQIQSVSMNQDDQQNKAKIMNKKVQKYQSPEDVKQRIAKSMIEKLNANKKVSRQDDFFILNEEEQNHAIFSQKNGQSSLKQKGQETYDQQIVEQLKHQHLRKHNKLYQTQTSYFQNLCICQPIEYKGHLQTITAIQVTPTNIYSCSKDRSIIRWDRQTGKKDFISLGKDLEHHRAEVLTMSLHTNNDNILATSGEDTLIKIWDIRQNSCIGTLKGHKSAVHGLKFGLNSNILCSVSKDLTLKQWDVSQRGLMETFFQHNNQILDIDHFNGTDFVTSGNDHQTIVWKTQNQTKIVYRGHEYAIDRVRSINQERFVTASMDGQINLWHAKRNKPVFKNVQAHKGWICALDTLKQTNILASGGTDNTVKIWGIQAEMKGMELIKEIKMKGITTDIKLFKNQLVATQCEQTRLGRWITAKTRNKIKVYKFKNQN